MKNSDVPRRALRRAVEECGGREVLSDELNVSDSDLESWLSGEKDVPMPFFIQTVGLLLEATSRRPPKSRSSDPSDGSRKRKH